MEEKHLGAVIRSDLYKFQYVKDLVNNWSM